MRAMTPDEDMYFSSSDEDQGPSKKITSIKNNKLKDSVMRVQDNPYEQQQFNDNESLNDTQELSGEHIFNLFCDEQKLESILKRGRKDCTIGIRFCWRMQYFIGEIAISVQQFILSRKKMVNGILLDQKQIAKIAMFFLQKMNLKAKDLDYLKAKQNIILMHKHKAYDYKVAAQLYSYFMKIVYLPINFDMMLDFKAKVGMTNGINPGKTVNNRMQNNNYVPNNISQTSTQDNEQIKKTPETPKGENPQGKWSQHQQIQLCKIYASHDSPEACSHLMEQVLGSNPRWKNGELIQEKMYLLAAKVFNKFMTLNTANENIKQFRDYKTLVLRETDLSTRKKIFRSIATIYESMFDVTETKKKIISQKILEVNRYCKDFLSLK